MAEPWLATMRGMLGLEEASGSTDNPAVLALATKIAAKFPEMASYCGQYKHDSIAWCGLASAYAMAMNGIRPPFGPTDTTRFLWANAWQSYGTPSEPRVGAIACFNRHVAIVDAVDGDTITVVGGNQSSDEGGAVTRSRRRRSEVVAFRWPPSPITSTQPQQPIGKGVAMRIENITATVFGGADDRNQNNATAYGLTGWASKAGVALPYKYPSPRPQVRLTNRETGLATIAPIIDRGPWNLNDDFTLTGRRPWVETQFQNKMPAENGRVPTNDAAVDLTPVTAAAIGLKGRGKVDIEILAEGEVIAPGDDQGQAGSGNQNPAGSVAGIDQLLRLGVYFLVRDRLTAEQREAAEAQLINVLVPGGAFPALPGPTTEPPVKPAPQPAPAPVQPKPGVGSDFITSLLALFGGIGLQGAGQVGWPVGEAGTTAGFLTNLIPLAGLALSWFTGSNVTGRLLGGLASGISSAVRPAK